MKKHKKSDQSIHVEQRDKFKEQLQIRDLKWTDKQKEFLKLALDKDTKIMFINGAAGTSKTLLSTYCALKLINEKKVSDITYIRSAVESSNAKLGFLPGTVEEKIAQYGIPFLDKLDELLPRHSVDKLINEGRVIISPTNFLRGTSWNAKAIILDEAQSLTTKELITVLTRIGNFCKVFILADPDQSDLNEKTVAFETITKLFNDESARNQGIHYFEFGEDDIMRSELVKFMVKRFKFLK